MSDYINRFIAAFVIGLAIVTGSSWISAAIRDQKVVEYVEVQMRNPNGYLVTQTHIYRPDGSVCVAFEDSLDAVGVMKQFEEWGE